jgi:hypothetical protein
MAYIGRGTESISNVEVLDNLTFDGSASYTLQKSSVNFVPSSANNLLISISGVVQQGNFSVSGSTITFDTVVSGSDTCDWILHYGTGLITTVADGTITEAKLGSNAVTTAKINNGAVSYAKTDGNFGKIGQVLHTDTTTQVTTTSSSFTQYTQLNRTITPTSTSSKILVQVSLSFFLLGGNYNDAGFQITQDGTSIANYGFGGYKADSTFAFAISPVFLQTLHSPSSTSELTYGVKFNQPQGNETLVITYQGASTGEQQRSSITVMEVLV